MNTKYLKTTKIYLVELFAMILSRYQNEHLVQSVPLRSDNFQVHVSYQLPRPSGQFHLVKIQIRCHDAERIKCL